MTQHKKANIHTNFVDLNPRYSENRLRKHQEAVKVRAEIWMTQLGEALVKMVKDKQRQIFYDRLMVTTNLHDMVLNGKGKVLQSLSDTYRGDLVKINNLKDEKIHKKVMTALNDNRELQTDVAVELWEVQNEIERGVVAEKDLVKAIEV